MSGWGHSRHSEGADEFRWTPVNGRLPDRSSCLERPESIHPQANPRYPLTPVTVAASGSTATAVVRRGSFPELRDMNYDDSALNRPSKLVMPPEQGRPSSRHAI